MSKTLFWRDFSRGRPSANTVGKTYYCTPVLVNAVLALGCHFTSHPGARDDPDDSATAGDHFFREAKRLIMENDEHEKPRMATVQAMALMWYVIPYGKRHGPQSGLRQHDFQQARQRRRGGRRCKAHHFLGMLPLRQVLVKLSWSSAATTHNHDHSAKARGVPGRRRHSLVSLHRLRFYAG
jgi:hypothetical protein